MLLAERDSMRSAEYERGERYGEFCREWAVVVEEGGAGEIACKGEGEKGEAGWEVMAGGVWCGVKYEEVMDGGRGTF